MSKIRNMKQYVLLSLFALVAVFLFSVNIHAASNTGTAYFTVEKFTIGQGYLIEPCQVAITEGEKLSAVTERVLKQKGYGIDVETGSDWYLAGIQNADPSRTAVFPNCVRNIMNDATLNTSQTNADSDLTVFDYTRSSGWCFFVNNKSITIYASGISVHNGDVIRLRFTVVEGNDLRKTDSSKYVNQANLDEIIKKMAIFNTEKALCVEKGYQSAYNTALQFTANMDNYVIASDDSDKAAVEAKVKTISDKLPTASNIQTWKAQKAAAEKAAAEKAAAEKIKQNTPAVPKWKSVKAKTGRKAVLTWKKVSNATGYEVYMSTKKSSGYKKIATLKKAKKITCTKTKLKKNKKYYFKVRAYRTVGGVKYASGFSAVKNIKAK